MRRSNSCWSLTFWMTLVCSNIPLKAAFQIPHQQQQPSVLIYRSFTLQQQSRRTTITRTTALHAKRKPAKSRKSAAAAAAAAKETIVPVSVDVDDKAQDDTDNTKRKELKTYPARFLADNGIRLSTDVEGRVHAERAPILSPGNDFHENNTEPTSVKSESTETIAVTKDENEIVTSKSSNKKEEKIENPTTTNKSAAVEKVQTNEPITAEVVESSNKVDEETTTKPPKKPLFFKRNNKKESRLVDQPATVVPSSGFNVVLTHCTADFDSLASAVGLAKLWASTDSSVASSSEEQHKDDDTADGNSKSNYDSASHVPTFVVLPRGAHPGVQRFLALHKHLFPIRSLQSLPDDLTGLNRLGLVDAQRRDRIGPAEKLLPYANRITVVDHHIDSDTDLEASDYVVDQVGSVSTLIAERLQEADLELTEAEATLLALGIHADTGSLCYDSTSPRDAMALAWVMSQGASQPAIAEHAQSSLSPEQQGVLTQTLINTNSTVIHGVTLSTVLLSADGFINGLAAVTADALELSSSDVFLLAVVYEAQSGGRRRSKTNKKNQGERLSARLLSKMEEHTAASTNTNPSLLSSSKETHEDIGHVVKFNSSPNPMHNYTAEEMAQAQIMFAEAWQGGEEALRRRRLQAAFDRNDLDSSGYLERGEIAATLAASGIIASEEAIQELMQALDTDSDGRVSFEEFVAFAIDAEKRQQEEDSKGGSKASTMIIIGRVKAGVNTKAVKLNKLLERFGGGGHPKAASATLRLNEESEAEGILQGLVDEIIDTNLQEQVRVMDFMTAPVLSVKPHMNEQQVEDLFTRYDVRALPVVDDENEVIGLVTYKEVAAAKQRLWNKEQKRLRREKELAEKGEEIPMEQNEAKDKKRKAGSTVKGWMKQHVRIVEDSTTMAEAEAILLESDVGCIPVVADGTKKLVGMVTRTDLLRQHRYYPSLHYHNKGFADSISKRKPIIELRKRLKKFDLENE